MLADSDLGKHLLVRLDNLTANDVVKLDPEFIIALTWLRHWVALLDR